MNKWKGDSAAQSEVIIKDLQPGLTLHHSYKGPRCSFYNVCYKHLPSGNGKKEKYQARIRSLIVNLDED